MSDPTNSARRVVVVGGVAGGAGVVDRGEQSHDGYEAVVEAFGPGAPAPMFATVPAADAPTVVELALAGPGVIAASIVAEPAASGRTVVRMREGIARTGRPITSAAMIMIVVFIAFGVTGPIPPAELGVTLALAVLLDATVIRMMLVPSLLGMLGDRAWQLPAWLDRRLPQITFDH